MKDEVTFKTIKGEYYFHAVTDKGTEVGYGSYVPEMNYDPEEFHARFLKEIERSIRLVKADHLSKPHGFVK